jgi:hypothetical protein
MTYIYAYTKNKKAYVGKTTNLNRRKKEHFKRFAGWDYQIIDYINSVDKLQWVPLECCWITAYSEAGYEMQNKNRGGGGQTTVSKETRAKISASQKGRIAPNKDIPMCQEQKNKISISKKGKPNPKTGDALRGRKAPHVTAAHTGKKHSEETIAKRSASITKWWAKRKLEKGM